MNTTPDPLDGILRRAARPLEDAGFTERVLAALPRAVPARARWRPWIVPVAGPVGGLLAALLDPAAAGWGAGLVDLASGQALTPASLAAWAAVATLAVTGLVLALEDEPGA